MTRSGRPRRPVAAKPPERTRSRGLKTSRALELSQSNGTRAAKLLDISLRKLFYKMQEDGIK